MKTMERNNDVVQKYLELHTLYKDTNKASVVRQAESFLMAGEFDKARATMNTLPDRKQLLDKLSGILKHKAVYKTLSKVLSGKCTSRYENLKGLFSLGTHICIELERGNEEYKSLLNEVMELIHNYME